MTNAKNIGETFSVSKYVRWGSDDMFELDTISFKAVSETQVEVTRHGIYGAKPEVLLFSVADARREWRKLIDFGYTLDKKSKINWNA